MSILYDSILLGAWLIVAGFIIFAIFPPLFDNPTGYPILMRVYYLAWLVLYFGVCWAKGQTLGMKVWRLNYQYPNSKKSAQYKIMVVRFLLGISLMPIWGLPLAIFNKDKKTLADIICNSQLVLNKQT